MKNKILRFLLDFEDKSENRRKCLGASDYYDLHKYYLRIVMYNDIARLPFASCNIIIRGRVDLVKILLFNHFTALAKSAGREYCTLCPQPSMRVKSVSGAVMLL